MPRKRVYRPGQKVTLKGALVDSETGDPLAGYPIWLQQYNPTTGIYDKVAETKTGGDGSYSFTITLPMAEGSIRLRTYYPGSPEYKADASPSITLTVKKPKAVKSILSITVE